jgi:hypothetical protein
LTSIANSLPEATLRRLLSTPRFDTYAHAAQRAGQQAGAAVTLYAWNARVAGAMLTPLHLCEIAIRNAVAEALEIVHGPRWPWVGGFEVSLPNPANAYSPRQDLTLTRGRFQTTDRVVVELKFAFWESMFTSRHDNRIWTPHLLKVLPNLSASVPVSTHRLQLATDLKAIRLLRNRIAHHEPIFVRNLADDLAKAHAIVDARCPATAAWLTSDTTAATTIQSRPF